MIEHSKRDAPKHLPRLLNKKDAAAYCGVSVPTFTEACPPAPLRLADRVLRWDIQTLDKWIDGLAGGGADNADDILERAFASLASARAVDEEAPAKPDGRRPRNPYDDAKAESSMKTL